MDQFIKICIIGVLAVVVFDALGSLASRHFGFPYQNLMVGSFLIYGIVGFAAAKTNGLMYGVLAAGLTGLVDATIGWYISWIIGPGRPPAEMTLIDKITTVAFVTVSGAIIGFIGSFLGLIVKR